jgi:hypothetical protein
VATANPYETDGFAWLDVGRCPHLLKAPLDFSWLLDNAMGSGKFALFAAKQVEQGECFGSVER